MRFFSLLRRYDATTGMVLFAIYTLAWGIVVGFGPETYANTFVFRHLSMLWPEEIWGIIAILVGLLKLATLMTPRVEWRQVASLIGFGFWLFIAVGFFIADGGAPDMAIAGLAALANLLTFWRLGI